MSAARNSLHTDGDCAGTANTSSTSATMAYDDADRATTGKNGAGSYTYDAFGRQTSMPKADTPNPGAGDVTLAYYLDDAIQKISQAGTDTTFTLDPAGRRKAQVTTPSTGAAKTITRHYTDTSDNPSWVDTGNGEYERYTDSVSGSLGAMIDQTGQANIALLDPNGNTTTSIDIPAANGTDTPATAITDWNTYSEYGEPTIGGTTGTNASSGVLGYGWLGGAQRATTPDTAGLTLMGARVYNNQRGLFTSLDPVAGGNENPYSYPADPINGDYTSGKMQATGDGGRVTMSQHEINYWKARTYYANMNASCDKKCRRIKSLRSLAGGLEWAGGYVLYCWHAACQAAGVAANVIAGGIRLLLTGEKRKAGADFASVGLGYITGKPFLYLKSVLRKVRRELGKIRWALGYVGLGGQYASLTYGLNVIQEKMGGEVFSFYFGLVGLAATVGLTIRDGIRFGCPEIGVVPLTLMAVSVGGAVAKGISWGSAMFFLGSVCVAQVLAYRGHPLVAFRAALDDGDIPKCFVEKYAGSETLSSSFSSLWDSFECSSWSMSSSYSKSE